MLGRDEAITRAPVAEMSTSTVSKVEERVLRSATKGAHSLVAVLLPPPEALPNADILAPSLAPPN